MSKASLLLHPPSASGPVRRRTSGSSVEHLGRCVYEGIYEPDHPTADEDGFRCDVLELTRELGVSSIRYPGGNFDSGYKWEDAIGPKDQRPKRLDLAWHSLEPNEVGVDEYMAWAKKAEVEPMMAVNLGTRGVAEALDILEYCNVPAVTDLAQQRKANGAEEPYRIKMWCLGNEMDGPWQTGHKTAEEYARLATETARAMRMIDPEVELIVCGSSSSYMPTFGEWERTVLTESYDLVDMVSAHVYYYAEDDDLQSFLASAVNMDHFIDSVAATADQVRAALKKDKRIGISFDEWNVWYQQRAESKVPEGDDWPVAPPLLEDKYSIADAVVVGNLLVSLLRHTDRVWSASLAQLVNVIAPIMTEKGGAAWRQTTFTPFALTSKYAKGDVLRVAVDSPKLATKKYGAVDALDAVATYDQESGDLVLFVVNRSETDALTLETSLHGVGDLSLVEALTLTHDDLGWQASKDDQSGVDPTANESARLDGADLSVELPRGSWTMVRLAAK